MTIHTSLQDKLVCQCLWAEKHDITFSPAWVCVDNHILHVCMFVMKKITEWSRDYASSLFHIKANPARDAHKVLKFCCGKRSARYIEGAIKSGWTLCSLKHCHISVCVCVCFKTHTYTSLCVWRRRRQPFLVCLYWTQVINKGRESKFCVHVFDICAFSNLCPWYPAASIPMSIDSTKLFISLSLSLSAHPASLSTSTFRTGLYIVGVEGVCIVRLRRDHAASWRNMRGIAQCGCLSSAVLCRPHLHVFTAGECVSVHVCVIL